MKDDEFYRLAGNSAGGLGAICAFFGGWIYCAQTYGFLFGFGLGWLPSAILAAIVFGVLRFLWPVAILVIGWIAWMALQH